MGDKKAPALAEYHQWTKTEKFNLFTALNTVERKEFSKIRKEYVPTKSERQIQAAISYLSKKAYQHRDFVNYHKSQYNTKFKISVLNKWTKNLKGSIPSQNLHTETATALKMIADCENLPPSAFTDGIDFREVYRQLANVMEGKPLTSDPLILAVLKICITETYLASKSFVKGSVAITNLIKTLNPDSSFANCPKPTDDPELSVLRQLAAQKCYNPLNIPEAFLKPQTLDTNNNKK